MSTTSITTHKDSKGNTWLGPFTFNDFILQQNVKYVWFYGMPGVTWFTPEYDQRMLVSLFIEKYSDTVRTGIWILKSTNPWMSVRTAIIVALMGLLGPVGIALLPKSCNETVAPKPLPQPTPVVDTLSNKTIIINNTTYIIIINNGKRDTIPVLKEHNYVWEWEDLEGQSGNNKVDFRVSYKIIVDEFRWKFRSPDSLDNGQRAVDALGRHLPALADYKNAIAIVPVGVSSEEGEIKNEVDRADRRADQIKLAIKMNKLDSGKLLYKLNLGQHTKTSGKTPVETSNQRKVIVIGIMKWSGKMPVEELQKCLRNGLEKGRYSFDINSYSNFILTEYDADVQKTILR